MPKGWIGKPSPKSKRQGSGWFAELDKVFTDEGLNYAVMMRTVNTTWGQVEHMCIRNAENTDIPWAEKQRIKEAFYPDRAAIEVFPTADKLVDEANMYHLWVLPRGMNLPFGLK